MFVLAKRYEKRTSHTSLVLAKCLKITRTRVTFLVKLHVNDRQLYYKYHSSTGVFEAFCEN